MADRPEISLADLKDEPFISLPKGYSFRSFTEEICQAAGFTPNVAMECFHCRMLDLISAGLGVALVPEAFKKKCQYNHAVKVLPLSGPPVVRPMLVSCKKNRYMTKAARAFLEFLREYYATERVENYSSAADNGGRGHSPARTSYAPPAPHILCLHLIRSARAAYSPPAPHILRLRPSPTHILYTLFIFLIILDIFCQL